LLLPGRLPHDSEVALVFDGCHHGLAQHPRHVDKQDPDEGNGVTLRGGEGDVLKP